MSSPEFSLSGGTNILSTITPSNQIRLAQAMRLAQIPRVEGF